MPGGPRPALAGAGVWGTPVLAAPLRFRTSPGVAWGVAAKRLPQHLPLRRRPSYLGAVFPGALGL